MANFPRLLPIQLEDSGMAKIILVVMATLGAVSLSGCGNVDVGLSAEL